jgi:hypothetical protein
MLVEKGDICLFDENLREILVEKGDICLCKIIACFKNRGGVSDILINIKGGGECNFLLLLNYSTLESSVCCFHEIELNNR